MCGLGKRQPSSGYECPIAAADERFREQCKAFLKRYELGEWCEPTRFEQLIETHSTVARRLRQNKNEVDPHWPVNLAELALVALAEQRRVEAIESQG